jgi:hypothetical protein
VVSVLNVLSGEPKAVLQRRKHRRNVITYKFYRGPAPPVFFKGAGTFRRWANREVREQRPNGAGIGILV